jgi:hypothetical protein
LVSVDNGQDLPNPQVFFPWGEDQLDDITRNLCDLDGHRRDV